MQFEWKSKLGKALFMASCWKGFVKKFVAWITAPSPEVSFGQNTTIADELTLKGVWKWID